MIEFPTSQHGGTFTVGGILIVRTKTLLAPESVQMELNLLRELGPPPTPQKCLYPGGGGGAGGGRGGDLPAPHQNVRGKGNSERAVL